jgi:hypothetical protein
MSTTTKFYGENSKTSFEIKNVMLINKEEKRIPKSKNVDYGYY